LGAALLLWTMLALLAGQFVCFVLAVGYVLSQHTSDGHPSCKYKALLFGGIGFLLFGSNGIIAAHWAPQFDLTRWVGLVLYVLGAALLALGLRVRRDFLSTPGNQSHVTRSH
jgi:hypothetical protein